MDPVVINWHQLDKEEVIRKLDSSADGLTSAASASRKQQFGFNELKEVKKMPAWLLLLNQFKGFMIYVLIIAAIVSGIVGDTSDTVIILVIVLLNALLGFFQEYRAEKAMDELKKMSSQNSKVLRDGKTVNLLSKEIVPGDVVVLEAGIIVPADLRLLETHALRVVESSLTGESQAIDKDPAAISNNETSIGDRINMAYKGTIITNGRGLGITTETGMNTEIGKIATMLQGEKSTTPLQARMEDFGKKLSYIILAICTLLFIIGLIRGEEPFNMLLIAISLAVAAIPEALPALITIALSLGAKRLAGKNALMRKLPAVETLGSVTYICTDKTGTLTRNIMEVSDAVSPSTNSFDRQISLPHAAVVLNHDVTIDGNGKLLGDPMEIALVEFVQQSQSIHMRDVLARYPRVAEIPFDSSRKCMTTIHEYEDRYLVITKGAAEVIADKLKPDNGVPEIVDRTGEFARSGKRVIAYGFRFMNDVTEPLQENEIETQLEYAGLVALIDPPRNEVKEAIKECKQAGIMPVLITGDHLETATAIAAELGLFSEGNLRMTGFDLNKIQPLEYEQQVQKVSVYARVSPEQKLTIVKSLQARGHFVAMTGDGVNDAPSLRAANIGIAMGITGTDVTKEAADMILLDDNFATIVNAVREGRRIYDNIRKFVKYIMTCNGAEIWTIFIAPLVGLPIPLLPIHLLWINLITDGLPGLALSNEKAEPGIMNRPPRKVGESLFSNGIGYHIIWVGILMAGITLGVQAWAIHENKEHWQTMVFSTLSLAQLGHVFAIRSEKEFIFRIGIFSNMPLLLTVLFTFLLQLAVIYLPISNELLKTKPLSFSELLICMGGAVAIFTAVELEKFFKKFKDAK
jgi:P-type Ca2+ transporter type 2C